MTESTSSETNYPKIRRRAKPLTVVEPLTDAPRKPLIFINQLV
jgi:hypothetical protein